MWLTHAAWQRYFPQQPDIVGTTVVLDGEATTVAGVLPADFRFQRKVDLFVPIEPIVGRQFMRERENHNGTAVIARLKPGVTVEAARAQMAAINEFDDVCGRADLPRQRGSARVGGVVRLCNPRLPRRESESHRSAPGGVVWNGSSATRVKPQRPL